MADGRGLIIGAGAQGRVVAAIWQRMAPSRPLAFLDDDTSLWGATVDGVPVIGGSDAVVPAGDECMVALGRNEARLRAARRLGPFARVIDPSAAVIGLVSIGQGVLVGPLAVVHTGARLGDHVVINTAAVIEHDCHIEEGASVSPGVRMAGRACVGRGAFLAVGVTLVGRVHVGDGAIIGAGAVVTRDIPAGALAYGSPARVIRLAGPRDWERLY